MNGWLDELADELGEPRISGEELGVLLKLTREVAHGVERRFAPVSAFLLGTAVGRRTAGGEDRGAAFAGVVEAARALLPPQPEPGVGDAGGSSGTGPRDG
ncbi:MAG: DUF6457 domain-containing protein [Actinomycetota bacterium]